MKAFQGKGYGEKGEAMQDTITAEDKYAAKGVFNELFAGGVTVIKEVPMPAVAEEPEDGEDGEDGDAPVAA